MVSVKTEVVTVSKRKYTTGTYCTGTTCIRLLIYMYSLRFKYHSSFSQPCNRLHDEIAPSFKKDYMHETRLHIYIYIYMYDGRIISCLKYRLTFLEEGVTYFVSLCVI